MKMNPVFNLVDEPWVRVLREDGTAEELSLRDALLSAHRYRALAGETPTQDVAMLRLLLAVLYAALLGEDGPETAEDALELWKRLWDGGSFPAEAIDGYLCRWHERFWLFHAERPFLQVPVGQKGLTVENAAELSGLAKGKPDKGIQTASKLNGAIFESGNKEKLFNIATGAEKNSLSFAEAARWLVHVLGFDDGGIKPYYPKNTELNHTDERAKCTVSWLGSISPIYAEGGTLFETLLLNLVLLRDGAFDDEALWSAQRPTWEEERSELTESVGTVIPDNPAQLYTMPFRRLLLVRDGERVTGFLRYVGAGFSQTAAFNEQMTLWTQTKAKKGETPSLIPRKTRMPTQLWRELGALTAGDGARRPGIVNWISRLHSPDYRMIPWDRCTFHYVKALYDVAQSSSMTEIIEDRISFSAGLLTELGKPWLDLISKELTVCSRAAWQLGLLAKDLLDAEGGKVYEGKGKMTATAESVVREAGERFYFEMDVPFRRWLLTLNSADSSEKRAERVGELRETVRATALRCAEEQLRRVSPAAYSKRPDGESGAHRTAPEAWVIFKGALYKLFSQEQTAARGGETQ